MKIKIVKYRVSATIEPLKHKLGNKREDLETEEEELDDDDIAGSIKKLAQRVADYNEREINLTRKIRGLGVMNVTQKRIEQ